MSQEIRAIYENGLFRPLDPVVLTNHDLVSLTISSKGETASGANAGTKEVQRRALLAALDEAACLPLEGANDGFSGADHDLALYGWKK